jgi:hypothetical protein
MEKYKTMDYFAVLYLSTFKNDIIRNLGMDQWLQNPLPAIGDSGLIFVTAENVNTILAATEPQRGSARQPPSGLLGKARSSASRSTSQRRAIASAWREDEPIGSMKSRGMYAAKAGIS